MPLRNWDFITLCSQNSSDESGVPIVLHKSIVLVFTMFPLHSVLSVWKLGSTVLGSHQNLTRAVLEATISQLPDFHSLDIENNNDNDNDYNFYRTRGSMSLY